MPASRAQHQKQGQTPQRGLDKVGTGVDLDSSILAAHHVLEREFGRDESADRYRTPDPGLPHPISFVSGSIFVNPDMIWLRARVPQWDG